MIDFAGRWAAPGQPATREPTDSVKANVSRLLRSKYILSTGEAMTSRQEIIDTLMTEVESYAMCPRPEFSDWSITVAGVKITSPEAIARFERIRLERRLPAVATFKTCEDFKHLNPECCDSCHGPYEIYEMGVVPLPEGGYAWACCAMDRAIRPEWHAERNRRFFKTAKGKLVKKMFEKRG